MLYPYSLPCRVSPHKFGTDADCLFRGVNVVCYWQVSEDIQTSS